MNDTYFIFGVVPATIGFVGFVFSLVFGADILHWYNEQRALQRKTRLKSAGSEPVDILTPEEPYSFEAVSGKKERELVHS